MALLERWPRFTRESSTTARGIPATQQPRYASRRLPFHALRQHFGRV